MNRLVRVFLISSSLAVLAACAPMGGNQGAEQAQAGQLPAGSFEVSSGLWQVPAGKDDQGRTQYRLTWADTGEAAGEQIYYRTAQGTFTLNPAFAESN
jgi:hypothetical protein